jgi:DNA-binding MarR family transcriptional regulator
MRSHDNPSDTQDLALETLKLFRVIFKSANRHFHEIEKVAGVGGASLWALAEIAENEKLTVTGLAKTMSVHQSTASNLMEKLEADQYVVRTRSTEDRRVVHLSLSERGKAVLAKAPPPYRGILPDALMKLDGNSLEALNSLLMELTDRMQRKHDRGAFEPLGKA